LSSKSSKFIALRDSFDTSICCFFLPASDYSYMLLWRDEIDLPIGEQVRGHVVVVKFLRPRSHQSEKIGVIGLNLFGYTRTSDYFLDVSNILAGNVANKVTCFYLLFAMFVLCLRFCFRL